eukprot:14023092-Alexandrium_andersonii.AAC.1
MPTPRTRLSRADFEAVFGIRAGVTDCGLRTDYGLPPDLALDQIAGLRICLGPEKICIRPAGPG